MAHPEGERHADYKNLFNPESVNRLLRDLHTGLVHGPKTLAELSAVFQGRRPSPLSPPQVSRCTGNVDFGIVRRFTALES
jgi:hypothetical protein